MNKDLCDKETLRHIEKEELKEEARELGYEDLEPEDEDYISMRTLGLIWKDFV